MPLTAIFKGELIIAPLVSDELWGQIHRGARQPELKMRCCGRRCVPVVNEQGTRFFRHDALSSCGGDSGELEWMRLRSALCDGAARVGYAPDPDWDFGPYARPSVRMVAAAAPTTVFALLRRRISMIEARARVAKAAASGETVVWLGSSAAVDKLALTELPTFVADEKAGSVASVEGLIALAGTVFCERWLTGRILFASRTRPTRRQVLAVDVAEGLCARCGERYPTLAPRGSWLATCGRPVSPARLRDLAIDNPVFAEMSASRTVHVSFDSEMGWRILCPRCSVPLTGIARRHTAAPERLDIAVQLSEDACIGARDPHWCVGDCRSE
jgi:hypothetical protein